MENEQLIKFTIGKRLFHTEKLVTKWVDESKKGLTFSVHKKLIYDYGKKNNNIRTT